MSLSTPAVLVPPVRLGRLLGEARLAKGESLEDLSRRCGLAFEERWFAEVESGQVDLDEPTVRWLGEVYGIESSNLVPARSQLIIDLNEGNVRVGQSKFEVKTQRPEQILVSYLALVHSLRDVAVGSPLPLRQVDVAVLSEALRKSERSIESELGRLLSAENPEVGRRIFRLRRRVVGPGRGHFGRTDRRRRLVARPKPRSGRSSRHRRRSFQRIQRSDRADRHRHRGVRRTGIGLRPRGSGGPQRLTKPRAVGQTGFMRKWSVVSGLVEVDGTLLLVANQRRNGFIDWSPPGGVIESGEAEVDALRREVLEETGLDVAHWTGPVYEVNVDMGEQGGALRVAVYRATAYLGEFVFDDPDGIVFDAGFYGTGDCRAYLHDAPTWVAEPLRDWLTSPWADQRSYDYRVVSGSSMATLVVERL